jgi:chitinase
MTARQLATFVKENDLDGVDIDYEDFDIIVTSPGKAEAWLYSG